MGAIVQTLCCKNELWHRRVQRDFWCPSEPAGADLEQLVNEVLGGIYSPGSASSSDSSASSSSMSRPVGFASDPRNSMHLGAM